MNFKIPIDVDGQQTVTAIEISNLHKELHRQVEENGKESCATFCQLHTWADGLIRIDGQIFNGEALQYLHKHLKIAVEKQRAQDATTAARS